MSIGSNQTGGNKKSDEKSSIFDNKPWFSLVMSLIIIAVAALTGLDDLYERIFSALLAGIGMILAIVAASAAVRKISKYGLGTGVPSVGMFGIALACIISIFSVFLNGALSPIIGSVFALAIGGFGGFLINKVLAMNIPGMEKRVAEITAGCTLAMIASFVTVTGNIQAHAVLSDYLLTGTVALGFIGIAVAVFHAYNANLGPDEAPDRTRMLAVLDASLILLILGIAAFLTVYRPEAVLLDFAGPAVTIFMSLIFILISYYQFWTYVKRDACEIKETGLLPSEEDLN
ncbi:hypothetical protein MmiEs2_15120 [Methanimicrococcus stummii]|uniref:Tetrahydromethanopterin S-methyltransferase subunit C n=1 Tax=Methanimicrococcus stummii TaxID=3028294 RepID=A0AA96ZYV4_9EURY|nr:tetrahydromethanopterin S-methyltransferase subunit C [Methanimicrococcus sp. Es2]WNY29286.1 hypothetical protein MmiEs2_15120 [Methanimicrococcus sp. Es2]